MKFEFSAVIDGTNCHIRASTNTPIPNEIVNDRPHKHYFMEFHCIFSGSETIYLPTENREIVLHPGQILMLPCGVYHGVSTKSGTVERLCFNFSAESTDEKESPVLELFRLLEEVQVFDDHEIGQQLRPSGRMVPGSALEESLQGMQRLNTALQLLSRTDKAAALSASRSSHSKRQKWVVEEYIERHYTDPEGMEGLAQALYLSQRQTRKLVRQFLGEDYKSIIIRRRMELAEIYLKDPSRSLEDISWQVGYRSYSGFQLCFKKYFGISPSDRRKQLLEQK